MPTMVTRRDLLTRLSDSFSRSLAGACPPSEPAPPPSLAIHALNRIAMGPIPSEVGHINTIGFDVWLEEQLNPAVIDDAAVEAFLATLPNATLSESAAQLYDRRSQSSASDPVREVRHHLWARLIHSRRQLHAQMAEFWLNHFSVYGFMFIVRTMFPTWYDIFNRNAFGNFRTMLGETAKNPCMLYYLDNYISTNAGPNENYARELFELHTLGQMNYQQPGGYIDQDVYEASRCFTGWTFEQSGSSPQRGTFKYNHEQHDRFIKFVLGTQIPGDQPALKDGEDVLDMLAYHPGTARHLAWKLCQRFVSDDPPESLVQSTADVFYAERHSTGQIGQTLRHIFTSDEFKNSGAGKLKRPLDWAVSAMRALGIPYNTHDSLRWLFNPIGHATFEWRAPDGFPDTKTDWATSNGMLRRWNFVFTIASGWYNNYNLTIPDPPLPPERVTANQIVEWAVVNIFWTGISEVTREALLEFLAEGRGYDVPLPASQIQDKLRHLMALCTMTPEFMRR